MKTINYYFQLALLYIGFLIGLLFDIPFVIVLVLYCAITWVKKEVKKDKPYNLKDPENNARLTEYIIYNISDQERVGALFSTFVWVFLILKLS